MNIKNRTKKAENSLEIKNLKEAQEYEDVEMIIEGDWGTEIYIVIPIKLIKCSEKKLIELVKILDNAYWNCKKGSEDTNFYFRKMNKSTVNGSILDLLWINPKITKIKKDEIISFISKR